MTYKEELRLSKTDKGETVTVRGLCDMGRGIVGRLRDIGLTEGTPVICVGHSPIGGMSAYEIRGAVIALRKEDADTVLCDKTSGAGS